MDILMLIYINLYMIEVKFIKIKAKSKTRAKKRLAEYERIPAEYRNAWIAQFEKDPIRLIKVEVFAISKKVTCEQEQRPYFFFGFPVPFFSKNVDTDKCYKERKLVAEGISIVNIPEGDKFDINLGKQLALNQAAEYLEARTPSTEFNLSDIVDDIDALAGVYEDKFMERNRSTYILIDISKPMNASFDKPVKAPTFKYHSLEEVQTMIVTRNLIEYKIFHQEYGEKIRINSDGTIWVKPKKTTEEEEDDTTRIQAVVLPPASTAEIS